MAIAGELIIDVIGSFVAGGIRRGYHEVKSAVRRRQTLTKVISGQSLKPDDAQRKAIDDLTKMIGNAKGELTEPVAAFIREIERSAIPESLVRCILANADASRVFPAFKAIYESFSSDLKFPVEQFFEAFLTAVRLRIESEIKDPALLEFVQAQNKELSHQLEEVLKTFKEHTRSLQSLTAGDIADARLKIARSFEAQNRYVTVETLQGAKRFRIKQLVVPARLTSVADTIEAQKATANSEEDTYIPYLQLKTTVNRAVILGDPGGGKSTVTQLLCFDNSNSIMLEASFPGKPQIDPAELRIPFRIVLRSFDMRGKREFPVT